MNQQRTRFGDVLVAHTIRAIEKTGPLEDSQAMRQAVRLAATREGQVIERARILAERIGLAEDMRRLAAAGPLVALAAAVIVMLLTWALLTSVVSDGRQINVVTAFFGVLGPHLLGLGAWLLALLAPGSAGVVGQLGRGIGGIAMWLGASRFKLGGRHGPELVREGTEVLRRERLLPWAFGLVNHGIWAAAFALLFPMLLFLFAFRSYELSWETTILSREFFVEFIRVTNMLPAVLRLPAVDMDVLRVPGDPAANHGLALWLAGCVLVYGLAPRVLLLLLSLAVWKRRKNSLRLDNADPGLRKLFNRFDQLGESTVVDAESRAAAATATRRSVDRDPGGPTLWIAFELPPEVAWPPREHDGAEGAHERVAGDSAARQRVLDRLAREPASKLVIACNGAASPDRGTARFLRDAVAHAGDAALLLIEPGAGRAVNVHQWSSWAQACGFGDMPLFTSLSAAGAWTRERERHG